MPTNRQSNLSRKEVEASKGSKEFNAETDNLTVEIVAAAKLLQETFEKEGYTEWIFMGVCSRKLLEKVQRRFPNPAYETVRPVPTDGPQPGRPIREGMTLIQTPRTIGTIDEWTRHLQGTQPVTEPGYSDQQYVYDGPLPEPQPATPAELQAALIQLAQGMTVATGLDNAARFEVVTTQEEAQRVGEHLGLRRRRQDAGIDNGGTLGQGTTGPANDPVLDTPF